MNAATSLELTPSLNVQDGDEDSCDKPTLDEDPGDEVDEEEILAEVKLAAIARKSRLFDYSPLLIKCR